MIFKALRTSLGETLKSRYRDGKIFNRKRRPYGYRYNNYVRGIVSELRIDKGIAIIYTHEKRCTTTKIEYELELLTDLETFLKTLAVSIYSYVIFYNIYIVYS
jgi:hypothetical protein